jgi:hypothetical protein
MDGEQAFVIMIQGGHDANWERAANDVDGRLAKWREALLAP